MRICSCQVGIEYTGDCNLHLEEGVPFDYGKWPPVLGLSVTDHRPMDQCPLGS